MKDKNSKNLLIFGIALVAILAVTAAILIMTECSKRNGTTGDGYPFDLSVTIGEDPATQKNFSWCTDGGAEKSVVQYYVDNGREADFSGEISVAEGFCEYLETGWAAAGQDYLAGSELDKKAVLRHGVYLSGLRPDTKYVYRAGDGTHWSEAGSFTTAPEGTAVSGDGFSFLIFSDTQGFVQSDFTVWGKVFDLTLEAFPDASFAVHLGDFTEIQLNGAAWKNYFGASENLKNVTFVPVCGNKDNKMFLKYNLLGSSGGVNALNGYYSFDYLNIHFTVLNTGDGSKSLSKAQMKWLRSDLESDGAKNADFRIVLIHKAPYSDRNHADDSEITALREDLLPVFDEYAVDVVLEGHDHYYFRSEPVADGGNGIAPYNTEEKQIGGETVKVFTPAGGTDGIGGVFYFMPGASGVKQHSDSFRDMPEIFTAVSYLQDDPDFCVCTVKDGKIYFFTYEVNTWKKSLSLIEAWGIERGS